MRRITLWAAAAAIAAFPAAGIAHGDEHEEEPGDMTVTGEIVDMGCYLGHGATGPDHQSCALRCIGMGMPMGLLTEEGHLYLLTMSHDDADPFEQAQKWAAEWVSVTGPSHEKDGIKSLQVDSVKKAERGKAPKVTAKQEEKDHSGHSHH